MWVYLKYRGGPSQEQTCLKSVVSDIRRYLFTLQFISKALARVGFLFSFSTSLLKKCPHLPEVIFCSFYCFEKFIYQGSSLASMASVHSMYMRTVSSFIGQLDSEWIYEVIVSPKMPTKNHHDFCPGSLLEGRAEILVIFGWHFGRNDDLINSFWI